MILKADRNGFVAAVLIMAACAYIETRILIGIGEVFQKVLALKETIGSLRSLLYRVIFG